MRLVAELLNQMLDAGIIESYAVFGALAQLRYTAPVATVDADILVVVPEPERVDVLLEIYRFCSQCGYQAEGEAVRVGNWPVQFVPVFDAISRSAVAEAEEDQVEGITLRVIGADYLALLALSVGRAKDLARILALLESESVTRERLQTLSAEFGLTSRWEDFVRKFSAN